MMNTVITEGVSCDKSKSQHVFHRLNAFNVKLQQSEKFALHLKKNYYNQCCHKLISRWERLIIVAAN